jgi:hypothetical protein
MISLMNQLTYKMISKIILIIKNNKPLILETQNKINLNNL